MATTPSIADFDRDTAVAPAGDGAWLASVSDQWAVPRGPNGGYIAALVLRAMEAEVGDPARAPRSLTLHYLRPPAPGPATVHVAIERAGRTLTSLSARLIQEDRTMVVALAAFASDFPTVTDYAEPRPAIELPEQLHTVPDGPGVPPIAQRTAMSPVFGPAPMSGGAEALAGGWLRLAQPRVADAAALAFYSDAWLPAPFARLTVPAPAPTIDLTIHFRTRLPHPGMAPEDPVLARFRSRTSRGGFFEEDGEVWAPDGTLLAQSRQLALLIPRGMTAHLGLGSNLGDRRAMLQAAVDALAARGVAVVASSSTYETDPVGEILDQPAFLNACLAVETDLDPEGLLDAVKDVERDLGRTVDGPGYVRHGPRPIDVDVLLAGGEEHRSERLTVPHPALLERRFVLIPLLELDFALATPAGVRLADALAALPVTEGVRRAGAPLALPRREP